MKKRITPTKWVADNYDCVFPFGKYKGYKVRYVIDNEPSYILWLDEQDIVKFTDEMIDDAEKNDNERWINYQQHISSFLRLHSYDYDDGYPDEFDYFRLDEPY